MPTDEKTPIEGREIRIVWTGIDDSSLVFANGFIVQHTPHEFILTFGYIQPPIALRPEDFENVNEVKARALVRIAVSPSRMAEIIDVLGTNYRTFISSTSSHPIEHEEQE